MAAPPARTEICDTYPNPSNAVARTGFGKLYDYVTGLLGATGNSAEALAALAARGVADDVPLAAGKKIIFEGATDDAFETSLTVVNPTADRTATLPDADLTIAGTDLKQSYSKPQRPHYLNTDTVTATGTYSYDGDTKGQINLITLTNDITVTFGAPSNIVEGQPYTFLLKAGDTNTRTFAWNAAFHNTPPALGTAVNGKSDVLNFIGGASNTLIYNGGTVGA